MKTLLLLRHAKSSWKESGLTDHDRPLNKQGRHDAPRIGHLIGQLGLCPDLIVTSSAVRARTTAQTVADHCGYENTIHQTDDLYLAPPVSYVDTANLFPDDVHRALAVGHNPGISYLLLALTEVSEGFPTAALAQIELPIDSWTEFTESTRGRLVNFWRPREL